MKINKFLKFSLNNYCLSCFRCFKINQLPLIDSIEVSVSSCSKSLHSSVYYSKGDEMATSAKKAKIVKPNDSLINLPSTSSAATSPEELRIELEQDRTKCADSILKFNFNKKRIRMFGAHVVGENCKGVVYWMSRDQRVQDNWAFLFAQKLALKNEVPLHVCFCLVPKFLDATIRHYDFLLKGLKEVERECKSLGIQFHLLLGKAADTLPDFVKEKELGAVVTDFSPLRTPRSWVDSVHKSLPEHIPFCQVDAHNIVPCWEASPKLEYGARTIRNKINNQLPTYLTKFPPVIKHPHRPDAKHKDVDWEAAENSLEVDTKVGPVDWATPGYSGALITLTSFLQKRLRTFNSDRNDPTKDSLSNLSPWFHFGQLSVQRAILCAQAFKKKYGDSVASFCEEAIVRRELADNFCYYNDKYDQVAGTNAWSIKTLDDHRKDKREYIYSCDELEEGKTHDDLWNSAQLQLTKNGKMHGFLRMYWAKKILEWTESPEQALKFALYLNDRYNLDGRDPSGYVGCMWSICGIHDQGWAERAVFGKIRYMNYKGCQRKFDVSLYVKQWGGRVHHKKK